MTEGQDHVRRRQAFMMAALAVLVVAEATAQQGTPRTPATVKEVMATITRPSSDVIFMAASEPPKNDQQWLMVRTNAARLAESARLLTTSERARDRTAWIAMSRELATKADSALKAAERRNAEMLAEAADDVYATCETCHTRYMQP